MSDKKVSELTKEVEDLKVTITELIYSFKNRNPEIIIDIQIDFFNNSFNKQILQGVNIYAGMLK